MATITRTKPLDFLQRKVLVEKEQQEGPSHETFADRVNWFGGRARTPVADIDPASGFLLEAPPLPAVTDADLLETIEDAADADEVERRYLAQEGHGYTLYRDHRERWLA